MFLKRGAFDITPLWAVALLVLVAGLGWRQWQIRTSGTTVLTGVEAQKLLKYGGLYGPRDKGGDWTPSLGQIRQMEQQLPPYLDAQRKSYGSRARFFKEYPRQATGITQSGRKLIFVYGFSPSFHYPRHKFSVVFDGGEGFFRFYYDLQSGELSRFSTNGRF